MQRFLIPAFTVILIVAGAAIFMNVPKESATNYSPVPQPVATSSQTDSSSVQPVSTQGWKSYEDQSLAFQYPPVLAVTKSASGISIAHAVDYSHPNPCNESDDGVKTLAKIADFYVDMRLYDESLSSVVRMQGGSTLESYLSGSDRLKLEPGFIDEASYGSLKGYKVTSGSHGCGVSDYYFPLAPYKTLLVQRPFTAEFNTFADPNAATYLALPGIIAPQAGELYFSGILNSLEVR